MHEDYSNEVTSDSTECEVADCALLVASRGAIALGLAMARNDPDVDLLKSALFPAKSASVYSSNRHSSKGSPSVLCNLRCLVHWM